MRPDDEKALFLQRRWERKGFPVLVRISDEGGKVLYENIVCDYDELLADIADLREWAEAWGRAKAPTT